MKNFFRLVFGPILGKKILQGIFTKMRLFSLKGMNYGGGVNPKDSGEDFVVKCALPKLGSQKPIIFDVGGNKGDYTKLWLKNLVQNNCEAQIFTFEPSNSAYKILESQFAGELRVKLFKLAISDKAESVVLYSDFQGSGLGSLANRDLRHLGLEMSEKEAVESTTLDIFCKQHQIHCIDFLKLDIEGFEYHALKGAGGLIQDKKIKFIQFEFGGADIDTRTFFRDFYLLLSPKFKIYRILKNGLQPVEKYSEFDKVFVTTNYLAELKS